MVCDQDIKDALLLHKGDVLAAARYLEVQAGPKKKTRAELLQYVEEAKSKKASFLKEFEKLHPTAFKTDQTQGIKDEPYKQLQKTFKEEIKLQELENLKDYVEGLIGIFNRKQGMLKQNFTPKYVKELMQRTSDFFNVLQQQSGDEDDGYASKAARVPKKEEPGRENTGDSEMTGNV